MYHRLIYLIIVMNSFNNILTIKKVAYELHFLDADEIVYAAY